MTDEELDAARAQEALCRINAVERYADGITYAQMAARLARENWRPVDPLVDDARLLAMATGFGSENTQAVGLALAALRRGMEIGKGEA